MARAPLREAFEELVRGPDAGLDLARVALTISRIARPDLDPEPYLTRLDTFAGSARRHAGQAPSGRALLEALAHVLFAVAGLRGNADAYYDARNSYLDEVLERGLGIPITLSIVYLEVGWRLGLALTPVSFPGHFLVRAEVDDTVLAVDPFAAGAVRSDAELHALLQQTLGNAQAATRYLPGALRPAPRREVVARQLRNLLGVFAATETWVRALTVADLLVCLEPAQPTHLRDRGTLYARIGHLAAALADLEAYLARAPDAEDAGRLTALATQLRAEAPRSN